MASIFVLKSLHSASLTFDNISIPDRTLASSASVTASDYNRIEEIQADEQLKSYIGSGYVIVNDGQVDLDLNGSLNYVTAFATKFDIDNAISTGQFLYVSGSTILGTSSAGLSETGANIGSGEGVFANKVGNVLNFRSLLATGSVSLISGSNTITISGSTFVDNLGTSTDRAIAIFNGTSGKLIQNSSASVDASGNIDNNQGKFNNIRFYNKSAIDPVSPSPSDGDRYYNTAMHLEMVYDESRSKWLSNESHLVLFGHNGSPAGGSYFQSHVDVLFSNINGFVAPFSGTVVAIGYTRTDSDSAVFEVTENGSTIAFLSSSAVAGVDYAINSNFSANSVIGVRSKSGSNTMTRPQGWVRLRWRR